MICKHYLASSVSRLREFSYSAGFKVRIPYACRRRVDGHRVPSGGAEDELLSRRERPSRYARAPRHPHPYRDRFVIDVVPGRH